MAIQDLPTEQRFPGTGTALAMPIDFPFVGLVVYAAPPPPAAPVRLTKDVHYTVTGGNFGRGAVTPLAAVPVGTTWVVQRDTTPVQPLVLSEAGEFPAPALEKGLDRPTMGIQELRTAQGRALAAHPVDPPMAPLPLAGARKDRLLAFDGAGQPRASSVTEAQVAAVIDNATLQLLAGAVHPFESDGATTVWPLPEAWGLIYAAVSLLVNIGGVGGQTSGYVLTDGADHGHPGRTVIIFPQPLPQHVRVEVRVPPIGAGQAVNDDTEILARATSVPRSLRDRFGQVSNPLDEGADKSGVADSRTAFVLCLARGGHIDVPPGLYRIGAVGVGEAALTMDVAGTVLHLMAGAVLAFDGVAAASDMVRITASDCAITGGGLLTSTAFDDALWGTDDVMDAKLSTALVRVRTDGQSVSNIRIQARVEATNGYGVMVQAPEAQTVAGVWLDLQMDRCFVAVQVMGGTEENPAGLVKDVRFAPGSRITNTARPAVGTYNSERGGNAVSTEGAVDGLVLDGLEIADSGRMGVELYSAPADRDAGRIARNVTIARTNLRRSQYRNLSFGASVITFTDLEVEGYTGGAKVRDYIEVAGNDITFERVRITGSGIRAEGPNGGYLSRGITLRDVRLRSVANFTQYHGLQVIGWLGARMEACKAIISHAIASGEPKAPAIQMQGCVGAMMVDSEVTFSGAVDLDHGVSFYRNRDGRLVNNVVRLNGLSAGQIAAPFFVNGIERITVDGNATVSDNGAAVGADSVTGNPLGGSGLLWRWAYAGGTWVRTDCHPKLLSAPPVSVTNGVVYVVGSNPTGLFAGHALSFAVTADGGASYSFTAFADIVLHDAGLVHLGNQAALPRDTARAYLLSSSGLLDVLWTRNDFAASNTLLGTGAVTGVKFDGYGAEYGLIWGLRYEGNRDIARFVDADIGISQRLVLAGPSAQQPAATGGTFGSPAVPVQYIYGYSVAFTIASGPAGSVAAPSIVLGTVGNGLYAFPAAGSEIAGIGISLPANGGTGRRGLEVTGTGTGAVWVRPSPAETATSTGRILRQMGGPGGETSGKGGLYQSIGGLPTDGDGGNWSGGGHDGVGTNRTGGTTTLGSGSGTGTAAAGTLTIQTGTGAAAEMTISNRTPGGITMRTDNTSRWLFTGSSYSPIPNGTLLPAANGTYPIGTLAQAPSDVFGNNAYTTTSDARLKEHVEFVSPEFARAVVMGTPIAHWTWLDGGPTDEVDHYEDVTETDPETGAVTIMQVPVFKRRPGARWHASPYAQNLRDSLGAEPGKYAAFVQADPSDPDSTLGIRQGEMAAYVHALVREHETVLAALIARIEALEAGP